MHTKKKTSTLGVAAGMYIVASRCLLVVFVANVCFQMLKTPEIWIGW